MKEEVQGQKNNLAKEGGGTAKGGQTKPPRGSQMTAKA